jgi:lipopolysaccharide/colanic/teichoic acid biosynthesis glycosyltransferase
VLVQGDKVVVLSPAAIATTLDADGARDGLPFMPEMLRACGRTFTVTARAERVCVRGLAPGESSLRQLEGCVVLEDLRCDGAAHEACQLGCMLLWKEAWLAPAGAAAAVESPGASGAGPTLRTRRDGPTSALVCQATELVRATRPGPSPWSPLPYLRLLWHRTVTPRRLSAVLAGMLLHRVRRTARSRRPARGGVPDPAPELGLRPGEWVQVRSAGEIQGTLDAAGCHRGLAFSADMAVHCGQILRVAAPVERLVQEESGRLRAVRGTVTLEGADCRRHLGCARQMPFLWREAWLRRASAPGEAVEAQDPARPRARRGYLVTKRVIDVAFSAAGLLLLSPVLLGIALAVRLTSGRPILFRQERIGLHGRPFELLKFRSMKDGPGPIVTAAGDPRVTRLGRVLRRTKLDELPQLWNVVRGDMSLVGPRPEVARYVRMFPAEYRRILTVRPGITDFAALAFRDEEAVLARAPSPEAAYAEEVLPAKLALYGRYLDDMSVRTDLLLLLRTLATVLR